MTVSRFDPIASVLQRTLATLGLLLCGCRPGLPPEPAGQDAADASAQTPEYQRRSSPYESSAFDGVNLDGASGHEGMDHGGMNHGSKPTDERRGAEAPAEKAAPADKPRTAEGSEVRR